MNDPRHNLAPNTYIATVVSVHADGERLEGVEWIDYTLPGCGDWIYRIYDFGELADDLFLSKAAQQGWFEFIVAPFATTVPTK